MTLSKDEAEAIFGKSLENILSPSSLGAKERISKLLADAENNYYPDVSEQQRNQIAKIESLIDKLMEKKMSEKEKVTKISDRELAAIQNLKNRALLVTTQAEKALAEARVVELEYKNAIQSIFLSNGLDTKCEINDETGVVTWPKEEVKEEAEEKEKVA